jgi:hypothetical protein
MINKDDYKNLETNLWQQIESTISFGNDLDLFEMINKLNDENFFNKIQHDDLALGLSGVDKEAMGRVHRRREYLQRLKTMEEENKKRKSESLHRWRGKTKHNTNGGIGE